MFLLAVHLTIELNMRLYRLTCNSLAGQLSHKPRCTEPDTKIYILYVRGVLVRG